MKIIDVKGMKCPMPLIETRKALKELSKEDQLKVITDNTTSVKNILHFLKDNGIEASVSDENGIHHILVNPSETDLDQVDEKAWCRPELPGQGSYILVFSTDSLGQGSHDLGYALIGAMLSTLTKTDILPEKIIFMNAGIKLVLNDSHFLTNLRDLEIRGVELISCGTCLDYYGKMNDLGISRVSNMLEIIESMQNAQKVINI